VEATEFLVSGRTFPETALDVGAEAVGRFRAATDDTVTPDHLVPPAAILAFSLQPLLGDLSLLKGAVHTGQEVEAFRVVAIGERLTSRLTVVRASERQGALFAAIEQEVSDEAGEIVLRGRANVIVAGGEA
jgi:hypothetical protein